MTSRSAVGALYDALCAFEGRRRVGAYPVHKRLAFAGATHRDIYEWVGDQVGLGMADRVLDVGCGVGFGTICLAELGVARATGVTISKEERNHAIRAASRSRHANALEFIEGSFERPLEGAYDVIVAVESLKHSSDLRATLRDLHGCLAPGGRLVVVEDVFDGDPSSVTAQRVMDDWMLTRLYRETDYTTAVSAAAAWRVVDLTGGVRPSGRLALAGKLSVLTLALRLRGQSGAALRAFRGGLYLERLYAARVMRYLAMFTSKVPMEPLCAGSI